VFIISAHDGMYEGLVVDSGLNSLLFSDPYAKTCFTAALAFRFENAVYIDLDLAFTSYLKSGLLVPSFCSGGLKVYTPSLGMLVSMLQDVLDSMADSSIVILDSINSFYNMYYNYKMVDAQKSSSRVLGRLNHLLSSCLMFLVSNGAKLGVPVLATSMLRYRKDGGWIQSPASRRLLQKKSAVLIGVDRRGDDLVLVVHRHPAIAANTSIVCHNGAKAIQV
jgi:hypothetical protein